MKNLFSFMFLIVCAVAFGTPASAFAGRNVTKITSITLSPATVCEEDQTELTVNVTLTDGSSNLGSFQRWSSTSIDGVCNEHEDYTVGFGTDSFLEVFTFDAPGTQGIGNVQVKIFENDNCDSQKDVENIKLTTTVCGEDGSDGEDGVDGQDGADGQDGQDGADGNDGSNGADGADGQDGQDGQDGSDGEDGEDGQNCTSSVVDGGIEVCCGLDCTTLYDGEDGDDGSDGQDGSDGANGSNGYDGSDGSDGTDGQDGEDGKDGSNGADGSNGVNGLDGAICVVVDNLDDSCTITCDDSEAVVYNCGSGAEPEEVVDVVVSPGGLCGTFGGLTVVGMLLPFGFMCLRRRFYHV